MLYELENLRKEFNKINKQVAQLKIVSLSHSHAHALFLITCGIFFIYFLCWNSCEKKAKQDATETIAKTEEVKQKIAEKDVEVKDSWAVLKSKLEKIGNLVHDSVPVSDDEVTDSANFIHFLGF